jgi:hypothetical protein
VASVNIALWLALASSQGPAAALGGVATERPSHGCDKQPFIAPDKGADFHYACFKEPTISELLADPLTRILMKADHVDIPAFEHMLDSVAGRFRTVGRIATQPVVAVKASAGVRSDPSVPDYLTWTCVDRNLGSDAARSVHGTVASKISGIVRGSHCSW